MSSEVRVARLKAVDIPPAPISKNQIPPTMYSSNDINIFVLLWQSRVTWSNELAFLKVEFQRSEFRDLRCVV